MVQSTCSSDGCPKPLSARGMCHMHYTRWRRTGTPEPSKYTHAPIRERFARQFREDASGCWLWTGALATTGYGLIGAGGKYGGMLYAHRVSYELHVGPIPEGREIMHACDAPPCVNPAHLTVGTHAENMADMARKGRSKIGPNRPSLLR